MLCTLPGEDGRLGMIAHHKGNHAQFLKWSLGQSKVPLEMLQQGAERGCYSWNSKQGPPTAVEYVETSTCTECTLIGQIL